MVSRTGRYRESAPLEYPEDCMDGSAPHLRSCWGYALHPLHASPSWSYRSSGILPVPSHLLRNRLPAIQSGRQVPAVSGNRYRTSRRDGPGGLIHGVHFRQASPLPAWSARRGYRTLWQPFRDTTSWYLHWIPQNRRHIHQQSRHQIYRFSPGSSW